MLICSSSFLASVQESIPPPEDPRTFQTPNLLHRDDFWSHPATAPACGGNWRCDRELHVRRNVTFEGTFFFVSPGDPQAKRETGSCRQSPPRPHSVPAASQGLRLWLFPQPTCHPRDAAGSWSPHSQRCASARPSAPAAACSGQRQTLGSVCVTAVLVTNTLKVH